MSIYQIDVQKEYNSIYWTNVYHCNVPTLADATTVAEQIVSIEVSVHTGDVLITSARVSDLSTTFFNTVPVNTHGTAPKNADYLPLWNVLRCDFQVQGKRPGRKFLRLPLQENQQHDGILESGLVAAMVSNYASPLMSIGTLSTKQGDAYTSIEVNPLVAMRQLRRGSKRKHTPVI